MNMRLLPWPGDNGQPAYLSTDDGGSFVSRLADGLEAVQVEMAEKVFRDVGLALADQPSVMERAGMVPHLHHALGDALRVARSLRARLPVAEDDERSAEADAALGREIASEGMGGMSFGVRPVTVVNGPGAAAYRWPSEPEYVGAARRSLRRHLHAWGMTGLADTAELVLSELAGNACRHAHRDADQPEDGLIETRFERLNDGTLRIEVHDTDHTMPVRREPSVDEESGRGLALVDALTGGCWGVSDRVGAGKLIWALYADNARPEASR